MTPNLYYKKVKQRKITNLINNFIVLKNWAKHIGLLIVLSLGFFLIPNLAYACSKKTTKIEQSTCSKKQTENSDHKDCSKNKSCNKGKHHRDCKEKCEHNACGCSTAASSFNLPSPTEIKTKQHFAQIKKQKFNFKKADYSSGYITIWLPPKIS